VTLLTVDYAVAKGGNLYAKVSSEAVFKVKSGLALELPTLGVASPHAAIPVMARRLIAICVAPFGLEEGSEEQIYPMNSLLVVGESVIFRFQSKHNEADWQVVKFVSCFRFVSVE